jgi:hypothetical protein
MNIKVLKQIEKLVTENSTSILTALGISGTITTAYLSAKAGYKTAKLHLEHEIVYGAFSSNKEKAQVVWKVYIPTVVTGSITIGCIVASSKINSRRTAALTAAYSISEKAFSEYKEKVVETMGKTKEKKLRDDIVKDKIIENPPKGTIIGSGPVVCCDLYTRRYFNSDMETLRKAQNDLNAYLMRHDRATLSHFYDLVGLPHTSHSWDVGWTSDKLMGLEFTTVLSEDSKPCLAFDFNYIKAV